jgi:ribosome biogenesis GTPase
VAKKRKRSRAGKSARRGAARGRVRPHDESFEDEPLREKLLRGRENVGTVPEEASRSELAADVREGRVVSIRGREALVEPHGGGEPVLAILRKSTRVPHAGSSPVVVGDRVRYLAHGPPPFVLTEIEPRRTRLVRSRGGAQEHVICANVDLGVIVASAAEPPFKPRLVDRVLLSVRLGGLAPLLVLNKVDLVEPAETEVLLRPYRRLGFPCVPVSAATGEGIEALVEVLRDRTSVFSGQSGVGKTALLNRLGPGLDLATRDVYGRAGKGRHTTSASTLYRFPFGGAVVDTPGVRSFSLSEPTEDALRAFFPEVFEAGESCRFSDCRHRGDEGCAVPAAIASGKIVPERLDSFLALMDEVRGR